MKPKRRESDRAPRIKGKPVIGITCEVVKLKPYYAQFELVCDYRYVRAVLRTGGIPVLLPLNPFKRDIPKLVDQMNGLIIIGGADIHPSFYGEKSRQKMQPIYRGRTYFDMRLLQAAEKKQIPVLCICYGMQLLNVYYGGTLHQDIQSELKGARNHRSKKHPLHPVEVQPGSHCHKIFGKNFFMSTASIIRRSNCPGPRLRLRRFRKTGSRRRLRGRPIRLRCSGIRSGRRRTRCRSAFSAILCAWSMNAGAWFWISAYTP